MLEKLKRYLAQTVESRLACAQIMITLMLLSFLLLIFSVRTVTIDDGQSVQRFLSARKSTDALVSMANLKSDDYKIINVANDKTGINISLQYTVPVYITMGDSTNCIKVGIGSTVNDAITESGISIDEYDIINLSLDSKITGSTYIDIVNVDYISDSYIEAIPYKTTSVYSSLTSSKKVTTTGVEGSQKVTTLTKLVNGVVSETSIVSVDVLQNAVDEVVTIGTKKAVTTSNDVNCISTLKPANAIVLDANGVPVNYKKHITVQATAYTYTGNNTASGVAPQPGYVAVNTSIFPLGTKFYIKSSDGRYIYGYAVAADTGGFIYSRPTNFDLFFSTKAECEAFGRRNIEVYVLD